MAALYHPRAPVQRPLPRSPSHRHPHHPPPLVSPARPRSFSLHAAPTAPAPAPSPEDMTLTQGANAFDPFEFVAFSTPATPAHHWSTWPGSPSPSPTGFPDPDSRRSLERDICSNFACCGLALADLHELLAHFEEQHVVVLSDASSQSSSDAPLVLSYPQPRALSAHNSRPTTPHALARLVMPHTPTSSSMSSAPSPIDDSALSFYDDDTAPSSPMAPFSELDFDPPRAPSPGPPLALPPAVFTIPREPASGPARRREAPPSPTEERRGPLGRFKPRREEVPSRKRERMFTCPRPGCTKTYLNPNGLKYHVEKGTCKIDPGFAVPAQN